MTPMRTAGHIAVALALAAALVVGCSPAGEEPFDPSQGFNPDPERGPGPYAEPAPADLSDPVVAVGSYLDWISFAYRLANSSAATQTMTPYEEVRVDSYVRLNFEENQAIEQHLEVFELRDVDAAEPTATVAAYEEWTYRYFVLDTIEWVGEEIRASYDTTYTVVLQADGRWLVHEVEATALPAAD